MRQPMAETPTDPDLAPRANPKTRVDPGRGLARVIDVVAGSHARAVAFLILVGALFFLPGFFNIPPIDRDEPRFAQASQADGGDRRFRRHPLPGRGPLQEAGRHLLAAGGGGRNGMRRSGCRRRRFRIWLYRIPSLIGAIGAVLLTYWTALAFRHSTRRLAGEPDAVRMRAGRRRSATGQDRRHAAAACRLPSWARWRASMCHGSAAKIRCIPRGHCPRFSGRRSPRGILIKGPLILMFVVLHRRRAGHPRSVRRMVVAAASRSGGLMWVLAPGAAVVCDDRAAVGQQLFRGFARR